jgi:hypothetical protein
MEQRRIAYDVLPLYRQLRQTLQQGAPRRGARGMAVFGGRCCSGMHQARDEVLVATPASLARPRGRHLKAASHKASVPLLNRALLDGCPPLPA